MIVKIRSGKTTWSYFEGDNVTISSENLSHTDANEYKDTIFYLREDTKINLAENCVCGQEHNFGLHICVQKANSVIVRILTNRATYLMNDLGKTVDKLF